jgi:outer membrane immunogenic protein
MITRVGRYVRAKGRKGWPMRWFIGVLIALALTPSAFAGDFDILRGMQPVGPGSFYNWTGFYVGGQVGYGDASGDFSGATSGIIAEALRVTTLESEFSPSSWPVLGTGYNGQTSYGGFVGYNSQWQDLMLGIEANYSQSNYSIVAPITPIGRITPADSSGTAWTVVFTGNGSVSNLDYGTLRGRAGLVLGNFMPYGFVGLAYGQANVSVASSGYAEGNAPASGPCSASNTPPCYLVTWNKTNSQISYIYGATLGVGLDFGLTQNIFLRGEFEYTQFAPVSNIVIAVTSGRLGAGIKF